jgi:hypothetical protein
MLLDSSVRAIAHFNLAVECEFLNQLDTAALHYNMYSPAFCYFYYTSVLHCAAQIALVQVDRGRPKRLWS